MLQQGWPEAVGASKQIATLEAVEGNVRNDVVLPRVTCNFHLLPSNF